MPSLHRFRIILILRALILYPFRHRATAFDMVNAWWLIEASTLAYAEEDFVRPVFQKVGLADVKFFTGDSTQCFVANNDAFRYSCVQRD